ncbi:MAG: diguanylate cyclase [Deltaproteobacteria bacterium]|nr:diguanylate cyclase [Deltaproteobacteria bacterium]
MATPQEQPRAAKAIRRPDLPRMAGGIERLRGLPLFGVLSASVLLLAFLGLVDYWTAAELSFLVFYLLPVVLITLRAGLWPGLLMSVAATAVWFLANVNRFHGEDGAILPISNFAEELGLFFFFTYILSALVDSLDQERAAARFDPLTGVANRKYFLEVLDVEIARSRRYKKPFTLVYMDVDNFKSINDAQGHAAGDSLLRSVADTLVLGTRSVDVPARLGGDEFALVLPETGYDAARAALANLQGQISEEMRENGWPVTLTLGAVTYTNPIHSAEEMIGMADRQMYAKKAEGKSGLSHRVVSDAAPQG